MSRSRRRSACSIHSDTSEIDNDHIAEAELKKLQKQLRVLQVERQAYGVESEDLIRRQLTEIEMLEDEREEFLRSLRVSESPLRRYDDAHATCNLTDMLDYRDGVDEQLESEQKTANYLKQELLNMERKLAGLRRGGSATFLGEKSEAQKMQQTVHVLENKLDRGVVRFNKMVAKNRKLREELTIMHLERNQFQNLYSRMDRELRENRKEMQEIMAESTAAFEARMDVAFKREMLEEKTENDVAEYGKEMSERKRVITHDLHIQAFLSAKRNERVSQDEGQGVGLRQVERRRGRKLSLWTLDSGEWLETLEEAVHKIQCVTGEKDLDTLVRTFIKMEEKNYSLLNFVNAQNNKANTLKGQISKIKREMKCFALEEHRQQEEHLAMLRGISAQQQVTQEQVEAYHHRIMPLDQILDQLKTGIDGMFQNINCDRSVIEDKLASSTGIRDTTIMTYLGLVERDTTELLTLESFLSSKYNEQYNRGIAAQQLLGQIPPVQMQNPTVKPPTLGDDSAPEESMLVHQVVLLTKGQLLPLVKKKVLKKAMKLDRPISREYVRSRSLPRVQDQHSAHKWHSSGRRSSIHL